MALPSSETAAVEPPRLIILTGMSGAGKQLAARDFEDMGWRVVDNLPPRLIPGVIAEISPDDAPLCLISDIRGGNVLELLPAVERLRESGVRPVLLFLDASDEALIRRFKETRRPHPLFESANGIAPAIAQERELLGDIKLRADNVIDTTDTTPTELRRRITDLFPTTGAAPYAHPLIVTVLSFGFKHGVPLDVDLLFDVRFLNNPHYVPELKNLDGRNPEVEAFVMADERTEAFLERLYDLVGWSLPHYMTEGKAYLTIGIGCTGGRHRSVVVTEKLARFLTERGYRTLVRHRDAEKG